MSMHMLGRLLCPCHRLFNSMVARSFSCGIWSSFWDALFYCLYIKDCVVFPTSNPGKLSTYAVVLEQGVVALQHLLRCRFKLLFCKVCIAIRVSYGQWNIVHCGSLCCYLSRAAPHLLWVLTIRWMTRSLSCFFRIWMIPLSTAKLLWAMFLFMITVSCWIYWPITMTSVGGWNLDPPCDL